MAQRNLSVINMKHITNFVSRLYHAPKNYRAQNIIRSFLQETAARANIFQSFIKHCKRGRVFDNFSSGNYIEKVEVKAQMVSEEGGRA